MVLSIETLVISLSLKFLHAVPSKAFKAGCKPLNVRIWKFLVFLVYFDSFFTF